jgi:CDP-paratose 2-epimerase
MQKTAGQIYNVGGGIKNSVSLLEVIEMIEQVTGKQVRYSLQRPRPGDQLFYVTDFEKLTKHTGWKPKISVRQNLHMIWNWWKEQKSVRVAAPIVASASPALSQVPEAAS